VSELGDDEALFRLWRYVAVRRRHRLPDLDLTDAATLIAAAAAAEGDPEADP